MIHMDDTDGPYGIGVSYLKALIKQLPQIDKLVITKCLLHSYSFMEITRGLKLLIIQDSHLKFHPFAPGSLQQVLVKNSVMTTRANFKENDFKACKTFAVQDCALSCNSFIA